MLLNLHVKNLALIQEIEVDFQDHLNIMTGETGAGKSIIIGSIKAALGGKLTKEMLRDEDKDALIELLFQVEQATTREFLKELEIPLSEDGQVLFMRKLMTNGRSVCKINGETVTINKVREAAAILIDIHGQHEPQSLLHKSKHLEILDRFAGREGKTAKEKTLEIYLIYADLLRQINENSMDEEKRARELNFLQYELEEITNARLVVGEDEELSKQYKRMSNSKVLTESFAHIYQMTGYEENGVGDVVGRALRLVMQAADLDEGAEGLKDQLFTIDSLLNDFNRELSDYMQDMVFDEAQFTEIENRLDLINGLKVKYGNSIERILAYQSELEEKYNKLADYDTYIHDLMKKKDQLEAELYREASRLSKIRKKSAGILTEKIKEALIDLNFLDVNFDMVFEPLAECRSNGMDSAYFVISTNPGEKLRPISEVASGGELSRIMLAMKSVLADEDAIETLIFDEIDVGISGRTAQKVSERMAVIAEKHQVISITHLAQIAAMADTHYKIEKKVVIDKTITTIEPLSWEESVEELARITSGVEVTEQVLKSAREMKELAKRTKVN